MRDDYSDELSYMPVVALSAHDAAATYDLATESLPTIARGAFPPPHLQAGAPAASYGFPQLMIADLRFPASLVQNRAEEIAYQARSVGAPHSLRLWRTGYEQALLSLSREACHAAETAPCESLFWEQREDEFYVSVTFGAPNRIMTH